MHNQHIKNIIERGVAQAWTKTLETHMFFFVEGSYVKQFFAKDRK